MAPADHTLKRAKSTALGGVRVENMASSPDRRRTRHAEIDTIASIARTACADVDAHAHRIFRADHHVTHCTDGTHEETNTNSCSVSALCGIGIGSLTAFRYIFCIMVFFGIILYIFSASHIFSFCGV
jgi:hypothetical protein